VEVSPAWAAVLESKATVGADGSPVALDAASPADVESGINVSG
jgi:hypothetical protein